LNWTDHATLVAGGERAAHSHPSWQRLVRLYANLFPTIDPRDFKLTGEASSGYVYSAAAPIFFSHAHFVRMRLILLLRHPTARSLAEFRSKRTVQDRETAVRMIETAQEARKQCGIRRLYQACGAACPAHARALHALGSSFMDASHPTTSACETALLTLGGSVDQWRLVWRSWYHLFLPAWLRLGERLLVQFTDDFEAQARASVPIGLDELESFLRVSPSQLKRGSHQHEPSLLGTNYTQTSGSLHLMGTQFNVSERIITCLDALVRDAVRETDTILIAAGRRGVPSGWRLGMDGS
jgi:hypothetical protein